MTKDQFTLGNIVVKNMDHLKDILKNQPHIHYTYVLRKPDGVEAFGGVGTPIYVGIGQGQRIFSHVEDANKSNLSGIKLKAIREIINSGKTIIHCIDSFHAQVPWDREAEMIRQIGQSKYGNGPLTNEQDYAPSHKVDGIEFRKYKALHDKDLDEVLHKFKLANTRLALGPIEPKSKNSVHGKIYSKLKEHPGILGKDLVVLLMQTDFSTNKSAYTQSGEVCVAWLCGYLEGGFFKKNRLHYQAYENNRNILP